jgi:hypothetical protein
LSLPNQMFGTDVASHIHRRQRTGQQTEH